MDIAKLKLLCSIADTSNLTHSAELTGYTQSGVSRAMSKLEREMGVTFFNRTKHGLELTSDGELLMPYVRMVVSHYNRMDEVLDSLLGLQRGSVCIGTYASIAAQWLPPIIDSFHQAYPNIEIKIREGGAREIETWLQEGSIDIGFLSWKEDVSYSFTALSRDKLVCIAGDDFVLPEEYRETFPVQAFADYPFIASGPGIDHDIEGFLAKENVKPMTVFTCHDDYTIINMVENNLGLGFLPEMFLRGRQSNIQIIPVSPCVVRTLGIGVLSERTLSVAAKAFIKITKKLVATFPVATC